MNSSFFGIAVYCSLQKEKVLIFHFYKIKGNAMEHNGKKRRAMCHGALETDTKYVGVEKGFE